MPTQTTARPNRLSYHQLLAIAKIEVRQARANDDQANRDYFNHSEYGRLHLIKDIKAFDAHKKELFAQTVYTGADLERALAKVRYFERMVAEGRDRAADLAAAGGPTARSRSGARAA